jgi:hypothetical protein
MFPAHLYSVFFVFTVATHKYRRIKFSDFGMPYNYRKMASGDVGTNIWYKGKDVLVTN